jgi:hypothetical protein
VYNESVAWIRKEELAYMSAAIGQGIFEWKTNLGLKPQPGDVPLYTAPIHASDISQECVDETAKREHKWVGLTDEEKEKLVEAFYGTDIQRLEAIEAKLKEKNCSAVNNS